MQRQPRKSECILIRIETRSRPSTLAYIYCYFLSHLDQLLLFLFFFLCIGSESHGAVAAGGGRRQHVGLGILGRGDLIDLVAVLDQGA
jgi:hypothetical protein